MEKVFKYVKNKFVMSEGYGSVKKIQEAILTDDEVDKLLAVLDQTIIKLLFSKIRDLEKSKEIVQKIREWMESNNINIDEKDYGDSPEEIEKMLASGEDRKGMEADSDDLDADADEEPTGEVPSEISDDEPDEEPTGEVPSEISDDESEEETTDEFDDDIPITNNPNLDGSMSDEENQRAILHAVGLPQNEYLLKQFETSQDKNPGLFQSLMWSCKVRIQIDKETVDRLKKNVKNMYIEKGVLMIDGNPLIVTGYSYEYEGQNKDLVKKSEEALEQSIINYTNRWPAEPKQFTLSDACYNFYKDKAQNFLSDLISKKYTLSQISEVWSNLVANLHKNKDENNEQLTIAKRDDFLVKEKILYQYMEENKKPPIALKSHEKQASNNNQISGSVSNDQPEQNMTENKNGYYRNTNKKQVRESIRVIIKRR